MIVFGDRSEHASASTSLADLQGRIDAIVSLPSGIQRHGALTAVFIRLGQIVQGIADADRETAGRDGMSAAERALMGDLLTLAQALIASWESGFERMAELPRIETPPDLPANIELRLPEGYAFYGLYPEQYLAAAKRLELAGWVRVVGLRSIGTSLAAFVAAALGAPAPLTVRPIGHPFERVIEVAPEAAERFLAEGATYLIVDEGPGLSGSSFVAVSRWLESHGIPPERIVFLPSHGGGPGTEARAEIRERWKEARVEMVEADAAVGPESIASWVADLVGPLDAPLQDISGGAWRASVYASEADWPAVNPGQERRKFLAEAGGETWLVKFAGLGEEGERKLRRARTLAAHGLVPEPRGLVHGFLVERWLEGERLQAGSLDALPQIARYFDFRARLLPPETGGASLEELFEMAAFNIRAELGSRAASALQRPVAELPSMARSIAVDGRCDAHQWLRLPGGAIIKTDALDHDGSHDLIGAQDLAWDIAGVSAEFELDGLATERLLRLISGPVCRELLRFLTPCYLAFRLGAARLAERSLGHWPEEAGRNSAAVDRYAARLDALIRGGMTEAA